MAGIADQDIFISCAAVADYRPQDVVGEKIKKTAAKLTVDFMRNPDILAQVAALPSAPFTVGFAAETESLERNAREKLKRKRLDLIAGNLVGNGTGGFESEENAILCLWKDGHLELDRTDKLNLGRQLIQLIAEHYRTRYSQKSGA